MTKQNGKGLALAMVAIGVVFLFAASAATPVFSGYNVKDDSSMGQQGTAGAGTADSTSGSSSGSAVPDSNDCTGDCKNADTTGCKEKTRDCRKDTKEKQDCKCRKDISVITGKVLDLNTGKPIAGAIVVLVRIDEANPADRPVPPAMPPVPPENGERPVPPAMPPVPPENGERPELPEKPICPEKPPVNVGEMVTKTDRNGVYKFTVKPGKYVVGAVANKYQPQKDIVAVPKKTKFVHDIALSPERKPEMVHYRLVLDWGYLEGNRSGEFCPWDGYVLVRGGAVRVEKTICWDTCGNYRNGGDDFVFPQNENNLVSWRSSTTGHHDGLVLDIVLPRDGNAAVFIQAGSYSTTLSLEELGLMKTVVDIDGEGRQFAINCNLITPVKEPVKRPTPQ